MSVGEKPRMATRAVRTEAPDEYGQMVDLLERLVASERERSAAQDRLVALCRRIEQQSERMRRELPDFFN